MSGKLNQLRAFVGQNDRVTLVGPFAGPFARNLEGCLIFIDGGVQWRDGRPGISVGDGDSSQEPMDVSLPTEKDESDLAFALRSLPSTVRVVQTFGFMGGRRDHEWINLGEFFYFLRSHPQAQIRIDQDGCFFSAGRHQIDRIGVFSLITLAPIRLRLEGQVLYPLQTPTLVGPLSSRVLSNKSNGRFTLDCDQPVLVWFAEEILHKSARPKNGPQ